MRTGAAILSLAIAFAMYSCTCEDETDEERSAQTCDEFRCASDYPPEYVDTVCSVLEDGSYGYTSTELFDSGDCIDSGAITCRNGTAYYIFCCMN